jgi:hypothetical protein
MPQDPSALLEILRAKVSQTKEEKAELQNGLFLLEDELSSAFAKLPKGFKGSRAEYDGIDEKVGPLSIFRCCFMKTGRRSVFYSPTCIE